MNEQRYCLTCKTPIIAYGLRDIYCLPCLLAQGRSEIVQHMDTYHQKQKVSRTIKHGVVTNEKHRRTNS